MKNYTDSDKRIAALALNFCTVSISQIVSYNDMYVLEQEYDAILNNLNLKMIPKDEALLGIITNILDTISFLRIQDIKKERIEKRYQQRVKESIWSAIPSMNIFMSGNPLTIGYSLATTVGTGYMNYRKQKAKILDEKEDELLDLKIEEIEIFDSLKHELFKTAWKLADEYDFDDKLRLTEKQIEQYNRVLLDNDELRKYERLDSIKDSFEAYPTFWYFFGHTAAVLSGTMENDELKHYYKTQAVVHFERYYELSKCNILRNDQITASFALEYAEMLLLESEYDRTKVLDLIKLAENNSENCFDILQICAVEYLRIGSVEESSRILKILVNEDYNKIINAQILSSIYVGEMNDLEYGLLAMKVPEQYLYPMTLPAGIADSENCFLEKQKEILKTKFKRVMKEIVKKYTVDLNKKISTFDETVGYGEHFFDNNESSKNDRLLTLRGLVFDKEKYDKYLERIKSVSLPLYYIDIFEQIYNSLFGMICLSDTEIQQKAVYLTTRAINEKKDIINRIQGRINDGTFGIKEYKQIQTIGVSSFLNESFTIILIYVSGVIDNKDKNGIVDIEGEILKVCESLELPDIEVFIDEDRYKQNNNLNNAHLFDVGLFGSEAVIAKKNDDFLKNMINDIKQMMEDIGSNDELHIIFRDSSDFERYFYRLKNDSILLKRDAIAILFDKTTTRTDILFTTSGIVNIVKGKVFASCKYSEVKFTNDSLDVGGHKYRKKGIDNTSLYEICKKLDKKYINNLEQKVEYYEYVDGSILNEWFRIDGVAMMDTVIKVYAWPEKNVLEKMGYCVEQYFDSSNFVMQFYFDESTGQIINIRIVQFEKIADSFRRKLDEAGGVVVVK